ncbi:MAG: DUF4878 domain-containing protein, partial [Acidobacteria bacterium]|nr:DUF4878 domain-containing protein [Acidobacteriota bacterium]
MKSSGKTVAMVFICVIFFMLAGCSHTPAEVENLAQIYFDYQKAIQDEDIETLKKLLSAERRQELMDENAAVKLKMVKALQPTGIKVVNTGIKGNNAELKVEGSSQGQKTTGTIQFIKENGSWKLFKEDWQISFQISDTSEALNGAVETFMKDPRQPPEPHLILTGHQGEVTRLAFTPGNRFLVSASYGDYAIRVWDPLTGEELSHAKMGNRVTSMAVTADGNHILTADVYQYIISWPLEEGIIGAPKTLVRDVGDILAVGPDNKFVTAGLQKKLQLW